MQQQGAVIGHELRNPLASVVANVSVAKELTDGGDPRQAFLTQALSDLARVSSLLNHYLDHGQSSDLQKEKLDLAELAGRVCARYPGKGVQLLTADVPTLVLGDAAMLERMLENLLDNAFAVGAKQVEILLSKEDENCVIHVQDDGPGVPESMQDCLFETAVSGRGSSGIGLAVVRDVARDHGGSVQLIPTTSGALFRVSLPGSWA